MIKFKFLKWLRHVYQLEVYSVGCIERRFPLSLRLSPENFEKFSGHLQNQVFGLRMETSPVGADGP